MFPCHGKFDHGFDFAIFPIGVRFAQLMRARDLVDQFKWIAGDVAPDPRFMANVLEDLEPDVGGSIAAFGPRVAKIERFAAPLCAWSRH